MYYFNNAVSKYINQNLAEIQGETEKTIIIVKDFKHIF